MRKFTLRMSAVLMFLAMGTFAMAQEIITVTPENATAWDEITLTLDVSMSCPAEALYMADSVMMHSGVTLDGASWSNVVAFDAMGINGQYPKFMRLGTGFQGGISMSPASATAWDEITITLDANVSCPADALLAADSVMMHSGVTIDDAGWSNVVAFDAMGVNGQQPKYMSNGDGTWSFTFVPADFYGLTEGANVQGINLVFNGGAWDAGEGKAFDPANSEQCVDFYIPFGGGADMYKWAMTFIPADFSGLEEGADVTAINCVFNGGAWDAGEAKDWDPENPDACIDFTVPLGGVGINETPGKVNYNLYPNPVGNQLTIDNIGDVNKIEVYNVIGEMVKSVNSLPSTGITINTSDLTSGVYFVTFHNESGVQTTKFVKN
jgi:hypothetical protein